MDGEPVGELLGDGDPLGVVLVEVLGVGVGLGDDEVLGGGLGDWLGLPLADALGVGGVALQLGDVGAEELYPGPLDAGPPPAGELCCADGGALLFGPRPPTL